MWPWLGWPSARRPSLFPSRPPSSGGARVRGLLDRGRATAVTIAVPCRSDEPGLARTLDALSVAAEALRERGHEVFFSVCVNGPAGPAHEAAAAFAAGSERTTVLHAGRGRQGRRVESSARRPARRIGSLSAMRTWNRLPTHSRAWRNHWRAVRTPPSRRPASNRTSRRASLVAKAAALPHRFDFGVVRGPLYLLRTEALERMPDGLLLEDAWLSAELGARGAGTVLSVWSAVVRYRPAHTLGDYYRERLRTEAGKIQIPGGPRASGRAAHADRALSVGTLSRRTGSARVAPGPR